MFSLSSYSFFYNFSIFPLEIFLAMMIPNWLLHRRNTFINFPLPLSREKETKILFRSRFFCVSTRWGLQKNWEVKISFLAARNCCCFSLCEWMKKIHTRFHGEIVGEKQCVKEKQKVKSSSFALMWERKH